MKLFWIDKFKFICNNILIIIINWKSRILLYSAYVKNKNYFKCPHVFFLVLSINNDIKLLVMYFKVENNWGEIISFLKNNRNKIQFCFFPFLWIFLIFFALKCCISVNHQWICLLFNYICTCICAKKKIYIYIYIFKRIKIFN